MSDYCKACRFHPKTNCPITALYWAFLSRHRDKLKENPCLSIPFATLGKRKASQKQKDQHIFRIVTELLLKGAVLTPESLAIGA